MAQATSITINDGSATPVAVTYTPERDPQTGNVVYIDRRKTARSLQPKLIIGFSPANANRKTYKPSLEGEYPIEGLVNGVAAAVDVARFRNGTFTIPENMTTQDRKHFYAMIYGGMNVAQIKANFVDLEPLFT